VLKIKPKIPSVCLKEKEPVKKVKPLRLPISRPSQLNSERSCKKDSTKRK
jgi:hypothetical protein